MNLINQVELRIGNYIIHSEDETIGKIDFFYGNEVFIEEWSFGTTKLKECSLIKITKDWLIKFGYKQKGSFFRFKDSRFVEVLISDEGIDIMVFSVVLKHIKYVHQLQNLYFDLVGSELQLLEADA